MNKINMNKKGFLYTLAMTLFVLAFLSLSIVFFRHSANVDELHAEFNLYQKVYDLDSSTQKTVSEIFNRYSYINYSYGNQTIIFTTSLPNNFSDLDSNLNNFITNVNNDFNEIDVNTSTFSNHSIVFQPHNISFIHLNNKTLFIPQNQNTTSYVIRLDFDENITSCNETAALGGSFNITIIADSYGDDCYINHEDIINTSVTLSLNNTNPKSFSLNISNNGEYKLYSNATVYINTSISISPFDKKEYFELPIRSTIIQKEFKMIKDSNIFLPLPLQS